jgi:hypothetical protein
MHRNTDGSLFLDAAEALGIVYNLLDADHRGDQSMTEWEDAFVGDIALILMSGKCSELTPDQSRTLIGIEAKVTLRKYLPEKKGKGRKGEVTEASDVTLHAPVKLRQAGQPMRARIVAGVVLEYEYPEGVDATKRGIDTATSIRRLLDEFLRQHAKGGVGSALRSATTSKPAVHLNP